MSAPSNEVLLEKIENLTKKIDEGFSVMHDKQDYTNGNVMRNTEFRIRTQSSIDTFKWLFGFLGVGNLIMFAKVILGIF